jgi:hypothetical protein
VVVNFGWNDGRDWDGRSDADFWRASQAITPPAAVRWSRLSQLAWKAAAGKSGEMPAPVPGRVRVRPDEFTELLGRIERWAGRNGAELILLVGGARLNLVRSDSPLRTPYQQAQYAFGKTRTVGATGGPALVDGAAIEVAMWRSGAPMERIFLDGVHPSPTAHLALANALEAKLGPWIASLPSPG